MHLAASSRSFVPLPFLRTAVYSVRGPYLLLKDVLLLRRARFWSWRGLLVLVLARTSGSGPGEDFWFWSWRGLFGSGPGEDFWFCSWQGALVLSLARSSGSVRRLYFTSPRQLANKDRNELISYDKTSIERIDMGMIAKN